MIVDVVMPKLGESITEGTISRWLKKPGDTVKKDEIILEISTDKVESEIPSPVEGVMTEILIEENATVPVDTVIARVNTEATEGAPAKPLAQKAAAPVSKPEMPAESMAEKATGTETGQADRGSRFYSPLVLNIARAEGLAIADLEKIPGTGLGGRLTKKDLQAFVQARPAEPKEEAEPVISAVTKDVDIIPMDTIRQQIAHHMRQSLDTSAHVYVVSVADVSKILDFIQNQKDIFGHQEGFKLTFTPFVLQAVTKALLEYPRVNSSVEGNNIVVKKYIHLGLAVAAESGLIVPVIKHAEEKNLRGLARAANELALRARNKKLRPDDVQGATFSVSNFGVFGPILGLSIINQPNVAILGVGAVKKQPVVLETDQGDVIAIRSLVYLSLSFDHRIIDGDLGSRFVQRVAFHLENFNQNI